MRKSRLQTICRVTQMKLQKVKRKFSWTDLKYLAIIGLVGLVWRPELKLFFLFYLVRFFDLFKRSNESEPGLSGKQLRRYLGTMALSQFNPFLFPLMFKQACGQIIILFKN